VLLLQEILQGNASLLLVGTPPCPIIKTLGELAGRDGASGFISACRPRPMTSARQATADKRLVGEVGDEVYARRQWNGPESCEPPHSQRHQDAEKQPSRNGRRVMSEPSRPSDTNAQSSERTRYHPVSALSYHPASVPSYHPASVPSYQRAYPRTSNRAPVPAY
jgi:hypothetical protein